MLAANVAVLGTVITFIAISSHSDTPTVASAFSEASSTATNPVDRLTSYDIAANIAHATQIPEQYAVKNEADSARIQYASAVVGVGTTVVAKPQIVATALKSNKDIQTYTVQAGDSVDSLATKFSVTSDSIRWSNNLTGTALTAGTKLAIPPVNGIVYTVKGGDTAQSLAAKYKSNADQIIAYNDGEIHGLTVGEQVIIPNGQIVITPSYSYNSSYTAGFAWGSAAVYGSNGYDPGNCTWYAANKRIQAGDPVPANLGNAESWLSGAVAAGLSVGRAPRAGAVIWYNPSSGPFYRSDTASQVRRVGHVGYVDSVDADGSAHISDMNVNGLYSMHYQTMSPSEASQYWYIY